MIGLQAENVILANIEPNPGPAHWYILGDTDIGTLFIKVPRADITGGHGSAWREFLCGNLARSTGLLAPPYYPVRVDEEMLPESMRSNVHVADLPILTGASYFPWGRGDFTSVQPRLRSRLAVFDTWTLYYDRSCEDRIEFLMSESGERVLLDWEASDLPSDPRRRIVYSDFLFGTGGEAANEGLVAVSRAPDGLIDDWCSETRRWWPVAEEELPSFLQRRRDYLPELLAEVKPDLAASWNPACSSFTQDDWRTLVERTVQGAQRQLLFRSDDN